MFTLKTRRMAFPFDPDDILWLGVLVGMRWHIPSLACTSPDGWIERDVSSLSPFYRNQPCPGQTIGPLYSDWDCLCIVSLNLSLSFYQHRDHECQENGLFQADLVFRLDVPTRCMCGSHRFKSFLMWSWQAICVVLHESRPAILSFMLVEERILNMMSSDGLISLFEYVICATLDWGYNFSFF